jgi:hypothetical protein
MLENLYSSTLVTRVNIALRHVIPSGDCRITIIACLGAFDSHVFMDLGEMQLGRHGSISIMLLYVPFRKTVYLIDIEIGKRSIFYSQHRR